MTHIVRALASAVTLILVVAGCASPPASPCPACPAPERPPAAEIRQIPFDRIPGWQGSALLPGLRAFVAGCPWLAASPLGRTCEAARTAAASDEASARAFVESAFVAWEVVADSGLVTGYYEPVLAGSRSPTPRFRFPVHGVPPDL